MTTRKEGRIDSRFDDFLREEGIYESVQAIAIKRVIAWQLAEAMKVNGARTAVCGHRRRSASNGNQHP
jgi:antitoxin HicB